MTCLSLSLDDVPCPLGSKSDQEPWSRGKPSLPAGPCSGITSLSGTGCSAVLEDRYQYATGQLA